MNENNLNNVSNSSNNKSNTVKVVMITAITVLLICCVSFVLYEKILGKNDSGSTTVSETNTNSTTTESGVTQLDVNSDIVKNLVFLHRGINENILNGAIPSLSDDEMFVNFDTSKLSSDQKMKYAIFDAEQIYDKNVKVKNLVSCSDQPNYSECSKISKKYSYDLDFVILLSPKNMKSSFESIFGKEIDYKDMTIGEGGLCGLADSYDSEYNIYYSGGGCGGGFDIVVGSIISKAEQKSDEIYVYVNPYKIWNGNLLNDLDSTSGLDYSTDKIYLFDYKTGDTTKGNYLTTVTSDGFNSVKPVVENLAKEGKLSTYKYTFKKQSDGKYYVTKGEWQ